MATVRRALLLVSVLVLAACGTSEPPSNHRLVPFAQFKNVPLDTSRAAVERQFGTPLRIAPAGKLDPGATCLFYPARADAAPATEYQLCFLDGKLHSKFAG